MRLASILLILFSIISLFLYLPESSQAAISSCTASVNLTEVAPGTLPATFNMTITNGDGSNSVRWFKVTTPHTSIAPGGISIGGWERSVNGNVITFTSNTLSPGASVSPTFTFDVPDSLSGFSGSWTVQTSDDTGGASPTTCTGTLSLSVTSSAPDTTAPIISDISVTNITATGVTVNWTTQEASNSRVEYDVSSYPVSYTFNQSYSNMVTAHSVPVTQSIAASTTYYYRVCSTDAAGNQRCSDEFNFTTSTTSSSTSTPTPTATAKASSTAASTTAATATPFVDRVAPQIEITTEIEETYEEAPTLTGEASDAIGVTSVEYSIDGGQNWLPVDQLTEISDQKSVEFEFSSNIFEDGNYTILARALDEAGNSGETDAITIIIDRLPPRVGGNLVSLGPLPLHPNADGSIITIPGLEQRVILSAVGGATSIDLFVNKQMSSLGFNAQTGLWAGALNLREPGRYVLSTRAKDGAGNITERNLNEVLVTTPGSIFMPESKEKVGKGKITVYVQDPLTRFWSLWDGKTFSQENPQNLIDGTYSFFLPPGTYYLTVTETGLPKLTSKIFRVTKARPLVSDFTIFKRQSLQIGPLSIPLPDMFQDKASVVFKKFTSDESTDPLIGEPAPTFSLPGTGDGLSMNDLRGERTVITFLNTWSPPAVEQLPILDQYFEEKAVSHAIISIEETIPLVTVFKKRGGYKTEILVDRDGELVEDYNITSLPKHLFIDRQGIVRNVVSGVLSKEELEKYLSAI